MNYIELSMTLSVFWYLLLHIPKLGYFFWWKKRIVADFETIDTYDKLPKDGKEKWSYTYAQQYDKTFFRVIDVIIIILHFPGVVLGNLIAPESKLGELLMMMINLSIIWTVVYIAKK